MKHTKKLLAKYVIAFVAITGFQCAAAVIPAIFIPLIAAKQWNDETYPPDEHYFNFVTVDNPDSNFSTFDGNEHFNNKNLHFIGSYENHDIHFKYDADAEEDRANKTYKGTINDKSTVIMLKGTDAVDPLPAVTLTAE